MKCTALLMDDHKIILRSLNVLEQMAIGVSNGEPIEKQDLEILLHFLRAFADDYHQAREESALFPEIVRSSAGSEPAVRHMLFEHDQERSIVEALEDALHTTRGQEFAYFADRLITLIRNHIYKEDEILFDVVEKALSTEQDEKVARELTNFRPNPALLANLCRLEHKYIRKVA